MFTCTCGCYMVILCCYWNTYLCPLFTIVNEAKLIIHSVTRILVVRKNIIYLPDQLIMISRRRFKHEANISFTRTVVIRYASIRDFTLINWYILREIFKYLSQDNKENRKYSKPLREVLSLHFRETRRF